eukprot:snap_masked-scaffold_1-processed-gene-24.27-mRNA-1 protein AED:1.00 eAED:1.00 QI:0/-1/0/0/-1/1/1/0/283
MKRPREKIAADYKPKKLWTVAERREYYRRALKRHRAKNKIELNTMKDNNSKLEIQVKELQFRLQKLSNLAACVKNVPTNWSDEYLFKQNSYIKEELVELRLRKQLLLGAANLQVQFPNYPCENIYQQIFLAEEQVLAEINKLKVSKHKEDRIRKAVAKRELLYANLLNAGTNYSEFSFANITKETCAEKIFQLLTTQKNETLVNYNSETRNVRLYKDKFSSVVSRVNTKYETYIFSFSSSFVEDFEFYSPKLYRIREHEGDAVLTLVNEPFPVDIVEQICRTE